MKRPDTEYLYLLAGNPQLNLLDQLRYNEAIISIRADIAEHSAWANTIKNQAKLAESSKKSTEISQDLLQIIQKLPEITTGVSQYPKTAKKQ